MIWVARFFKYIVGFIFVAALALAGAAIYLVTTEPGLQQLYAIGRRLVPGELKVQRLEGRLWGPLTITGMEYRHSKWELRISRIRYGWEPQALWRGEIHVRELALRGLQFHRTAAEPDKPIRLPEILFPLQVRIDRATLDGLTLGAIDKPEPFTLKHIALSAHTDGQDVEVAYLEIRDPRMQFHVRGRISPQGQYPLNTQARWVVALPGQGQLAGEGRVWGDMARLRLDQRISAPSVLLVQGTLWEMFDRQRLHWEAQASARALPLRAWNEKWPAARLGGRVLAHGDMKSVDARGRLRVDYQDYSVDSRFDVSYGDEDALDIRELRLALVNDVATVAVRGRVRHARSRPRASLAGSWEKVRWPLNEPHRIASAAGKFQLSGGFDDYRASATGDVQLPELQLQQLHIRGHGTRQSFTAERVEGELLGGHAQGSARVQWGKVARWEATLAGTGLNPGAVRPEWPGNLGMELRTQGQRSAAGLTYSIDVSRVEGTLRSVALSGRGAVTSAGDSYVIEDVELHYGNNHVLADGHIGKTWDIRWDIDAADLAQLYAPASGVLRAAGHVSGGRREPSISISGAGEALSYGNWSAAQLGLAGTVDLAQGRLQSALQLRAFGVGTGERRLDELEIVASGMPADHRIHITAGMPRLSAVLALSGNYAERAWTGHLENATLVDTRTGEWTLHEPAQIAVSASEAEATSQCWRNPALGELCGQGAWRADEGWRAGLRGDDLSLSLLQDVLPAGVVLEGRVDVAASAAADAKGVITGSATVAASPGRITRTLEGGVEEVGFSHREGRMDASLQGGALTASFGMSLADPASDTVTGGVGFYVTVPRAALPGPLARSAVAAQAPFDARLTAEIRDLGIIPAFVPSLENVRGVISADLHAGGNPRAPTLTGDVRLLDGSARVLPLGIDVTDVQLTASASAADRLRIEGSLRSGEGTLALGGEALYDIGAPQRWAANVTARGSNVQVANLPELVAVAGADLRARVTPGAIELRGDVTIPYARIQPRELGAAVRSSPDVVVVDAPAGAERAQTWRIDTQVRATLGDNVRFRGFGVTTDLAGEVVLMDEPDEPTIARGEIRLKGGEYRAYGQNLKIERGRLLFFSGPVDNPGVDVRAVREIEDVTAGILVRGSLKNPQVTLFSEPAMAETDVLSYLVLGRPMSQATGAEGERLYGAAAALGLAGGGALAGQIGQQFGLQDVRIESGGQFGEAALVIRHYLSPKLYISYGFGLFEQLNLVLIRYQLSRNWAVEAQSAGGESSGADILYTIETE